MAVVPAGSYICKGRFQAEAHKKQWDGAAKMIHRRRNLTFFECMEIFRIDILIWLLGIVSYFVFDICFRTMYLEKVF